MELCYGSGTQPAPKHCRMDARLQARPTALELFTPKLVTVSARRLRPRRFARRRARRADRRHRRPAAVDGHRHRLRRRRRSAGSTPPSSAASWCRCSAAAGCRSAGRRPPSSCWSPRSSQRHGYDGLVLATLMAGADHDRDRLPAARHLHQIHPLSGDGRLHRRHRGRSSSPARSRTCSGSTLAHEPAEFIPKLAALWAAAATMQPGSRRHCARCRWS